jgi:hypothetical protein
MINKTMVFPKKLFFYLKKRFFNSSPSLGGPSGKEFVGFSLSGITERIKTKAFVQNQLTSITSIQMG